MELLIINEHDYSPYVQAKGYGWSREDVDSEKTVRTKDGKLRRDKIGTKRKLSFTLMHLSRAQLAQLDEDLSQATFHATYMDLHGRQTRQFYCSSFAVTLSQVYGDDGAWEGAEFHLIEI